MKRRTKILLVSAFILAGCAAGLRLSANRVLWTRISGAIREKYAVDVEIDDITLAIFSGEASARGVRLVEGGRILIDAESVETSISATDVIAGHYDFKRFVVTGLVVHTVVETRDSTNLERIYESRRIGPGPDDFVLFRDGQILGGRYIVEDAVTDPARPTHLTLEQVGVEILEWQVSGEPRSSEFGDVRFDALLAQRGAPARISLVGWAQPFSKTPTLAVHATATGVDLSQLPQYVDDSTLMWLGGDVMHLVGSMRAKDGVIVEGAIVGEVAATGTLLPMKFGGTVADPVFDERSRLADVFHFGFARLGHLGEVAFGWTGASEFGSGVVGAGTSVVGGVVGTFGAMAQLDPLGALSATGGGIAEGAKSVGEGVVGLVKRVLGTGDLDASDAEEAATQQAEFSALHADRRSALFDAALASAKDGPPARRQRLEARGR